MFKARCVQFATKISLPIAVALAGQSAWAQGIVLPDQVVITPYNTVEEPLTTDFPDAFRGLDIFIDRKLGNCVACHSNFDVAAMQFLGQIGPNLDWVGDRLTEGELRAILVDAKTAIGSHTIMPAFYTSRPGFRTLSAFEGRTILTALQVEDVVAYLSSLSQDTAFDGVD